MTFDLGPQRAAKLAGLRGLVSEATGRRLAELASTVRADHAIVEIGSFCGKSTCYLAEGSRLGHGAIVVAVDPWDLDGNIAGKHDFTAPAVRSTFVAQVLELDLGGLVEARRGFSREVAADWSGEIGLLFVDGSHELEDVSADFFAWAPFVVSGGTVAFDDYGTPRNPGVAQFVDELLEGDSAAACPVVPTLAEVVLP